MNRRNAVTLVAGLAALAPALAFTQRANAAAMGDAEEKHARDTLDIGGISLATARAGQSKGKNAWVKKFAEYEVAEQEIIKDILTSMGAKPSPSAPEGQKAALAELNGLSGAEFDAAFLKAQEDGHQKLLKIQDTYLANGKDMGSLAVTKLARGQIKEHLDLIATIRSQMRA